MAQITIDTDALTSLIAHALDQIRYPKRNGVESGPTASDLAGALCLVLGVDPTRMPLSGTTVGRVMTSKGRLAEVREAAVRCGAILLQDIKHISAVVGEVMGIEPHLPQQMETALVDAGVEPDVLSRLYWDTKHGPTLRQRMLGKWQTFVHIALAGKLINPTGYFVSAIRGDWHLSKDYEPGKKKEPRKAAVLPGIVSTEASTEQALSDLDTTATLSPAEQWRQRGGALRLHLRGWPRADLARLEAACCTGHLSAATLAREWAAAQARGEVEAWAGGLRASL